jgi:hypothetical protein
MTALNPALEQERLVTPLTLPVARAALHAAAPEWSDTVLDYVMALLWNETGRGSSCIGRNWGNLACAGFVDGVESAWWAHKYWRPEWFESPPEARWAELHEKMLAGEAPSAFRYYDTHEAGAAGYVSLLKSSRYKGLIAAAEADSPEQFVAVLASAGYSKDYGAAHIPTFRSLVAEMRAARGAGLVAPSRARDDGASVAVVVGVGLSLTAAGLLWLIARRAHRH